MQDAMDKRIRHSLEEWVALGHHREHYDSLEAIACDLNVSKEQLAYFFSHTVGQKFLSWRKSIRIEDAKILLLTRKDLSITQIGTLVGIPDKSDFRRQFYEITGCFPFEWRASGGRMKKVMKTRKTDTNYGQFRNRLSKSSNVRP